ncbi:MAG: hypothetical protein FWC62_06520 [Firmicutes bacterium]|nr:hypothetical protein [Bacillota bacterium]
MGKEFKERIAFEVLMILGALILLCLITRLWPLIFLVIPGILIAALRLLFLSAKKNPDVPEPIAPPPRPPRLDTEGDVIRVAFSILHRRVTERVMSQYPDARWVWENSNPMGRFAENLPLTILLNRAGGFRKASVLAHNLQFCGLTYDTVETGDSEEPPEVDADSDPENENTTELGEAVDYALTAFQWVDANLLNLNNRCNNAIAEGQTTLLIPAGDLPHPDSWPEVCEELMRNGFSEAVVQANGINVIIPK